MQDKKKLMSSMSTSGLKKSIQESKMTKGKNLNSNINRSQIIRPSTVQENNKNPYKKKFGSGSPSFSFGSSERVKNSFVGYIDSNNVNQVKNLDLPGPGNYNPNSDYTKRRTASAWSMTNRNGFNKLGQHASNPGPGSYKVNEMKSNLPYYKFGSAKKEFVYEESLKKIKEIPGPGSYNDVDSKVIKKSPSKNFSFGKEEKMKNDRPITPGPGTYNVQKTTKKSINLNSSIGKSDRKIEEFLIKKNNITPGPASYNNNISTFINSKSIKFSRDEKIKSPKSSTPGPGNYDV